MRRGGRAGEVVNLINLNAERLSDVVADELEVWIAHEVGDVLLATGKQVVHTDDFILLVQQAFAEMGAEESGSASDEDAFFHGVVRGFSYLGRKSKHCRCWP